MVLVFGFASASAAPNGRPLVIESTASAMPAEMNLFVMFFIFLRFPLPISFFLFVLFNGDAPLELPLIPGTTRALPVVLKFSASTIRRHPGRLVGENLIARYDRPAAER